MKYFAVIDTNVLISAMLKHQSVPGNILDMVFSGIITPVLNYNIESEYRDVLSLPKFHLPKDLIDDIIQTFRLYGLYIDAEPLSLSLPDSKDLVFYEVVMEQRKTEEAWLVTGNIKHFPEKVYVVTPRQMLNIILENTEL